MFLSAFVFLIWLRESQQNVCTDLENFQNLNNSYKPNGSPLHSRGVAGLLHCVKMSHNWNGCKAFTFNMADQKCTLYPKYDFSVSGDDRTNRTVVISVVRKWTRALSLREDKVMIPGYDCFMISSNKSQDLYKGKINVTISGYTCQRWNSQDVHEHTNNANKDEDFENSGETLGAAGNYYRMPLTDQERKPWCYTTDPNKRWEFCNVKQCSVYGSTTTP